MSHLLLGIGTYSSKGVLVHTEPRLGTGSLRAGCSNRSTTAASHPASSLGRRNTGRPRSPAHYRHTISLIANLEIWAG